MKKLHIISILLFSLFFSFCSDNNITGNNGEAGLNFYLLKDSTITANEVFNVGLNDLILAEKPFLNYKDLHYYTWSEHTFEINSNKANEIQIICERYISVRGIPFVVMVDDERIYLGAFWASYSSLAPTFPYMEATTFLFQTPNILEIKKSWESDSLDLRNDDRIFNTLRKYGLLSKH